MPALASVGRTPLWPCGLPHFAAPGVVLQVHAAQRGLDLMAPRSEAVKEYKRLLESYWDVPYPVHAAQLWAVEMAYNMGWRLPGPMRAPYNEFAERWGSDSFCKYVGALESQADKALESATPVSPRCPTNSPSPKAHRMTGCGPEGAWFGIVWISCSDA